MPRGVGAVGDSGENVGEVMLWVDAVELGGLDEGVHGCSPSTASIGTGEEVVLAANPDAAQRPLGGIVVERQAAVIEAADECGPARSHVAEGGGELGLARQFVYGLFPQAANASATGFDRCWRFVVDDRG